METKTKAKASKPGGKKAKAKDNGKPSGNLPVRPRRTDQATSKKAAKKKTKPKRASKQKELFAKRSPKHQKIYAVAQEYHDAQEQVELHKEDVAAAEAKLKALFKSERITGPYRAGEYVCKPTHTQPKDSIRVEKKFSEEEEEEADS